jgi:hypothetical protein
LDLYDDNKLRMARGCIATPATFLDTVILRVQSRGQF